MSKRRINPATGEAELTYREHKLVDEYINKGGNGKQAAIAGGFGAARAGQSAYQVLRRAQVQQHIRDRIAESRVSTEEIIGTLVSRMRGDLSECLNEDGHPFRLETQDSRLPADSRLLADSRLPIKTSTVAGSYAREGVGREPKKNQYQSMFKPRRWRYRSASTLP